MFPVKIKNHIKDGTFPIHYYELVSQIAVNKNNGEHLELSMGNLIFQLIFKQRHLIYVFDREMEDTL